MCTHRCGGHSTAIGAARAMCFQPPTNPVLQGHILVGKTGAGVSAFAGGVGGLKKPSELGQLLQGNYCLVAPELHVCHWRAQLNREKKELSLSLVNIRPQI